MPPLDQVASRLLRSRTGKVCAAITGGTPEELCSRATEALGESSFLEFRLDYLPDPAATLPELGRFIASHNGATFVATCRPKRFGGRFAGTSAQAYQILLGAAGCGFQLVDLDLKAAEALGAAALDPLRQAGAGVILSDHNFEGLDDPRAIYARMEPFAPDFAKIAGTAQRLTDNLTMLSFLAETEDRADSRLVGICMGEKGMLSRVLGLRAGAAFTFASAVAGEETAPGQIAARALLEVYRIDQLDKATRVYGVAGDPIGSSLSPLMLNSAFRRETVNAVYVALATSDPKELLKLAREIPLGGMSVTMPLKQSIIPLLERTDPLSARIGAVNTVLRTQDGKFYGFNTDVAGIVGPLERRMSLRDAKVLVLGAGGAARAAVFGCIDKGAQVSILNRTPAPAAALAKAAGAKVIKREAVAKAGFDVVINSTPAGMLGVEAESLLRPEDLNARIVFDLVYNPIDTPLLQLARQKGLTAISGVEMFVTQGARQFEIWTGKAAPQDEMMRVVLHALRQRESPIATAASHDLAANAAEPVAEPAETRPPSSVGKKPGTTPRTPARPAGSRDRKPVTPGTGSPVASRTPATGSTTGGKRRAVPVKVGHSPAAARKAAPSRRSR